MKWLASPFVFYTVVMIAGTAGWVAMRASDFSYNVTAATVLPLVAIMSILSPRSKR